MIVGSRITENPWIYRALQGPHAEIKFAPVLAHCDLASARRVLDVGCGPGVNTHHFAGHEYLGIDLSARYIRHARRRHPREFRVADARTFAYGEGVYDLILANSLFHHLDTAGVRETLRRLAAALVPGGHIHILDLVYPERRCPARTMAHWDNGLFVRRLEEWRGLFTESFEPVVFEPYELGLFGVTLWEMVYFKGQPRGGGSCGHGAEG